MNPVPVRHSSRNCLIEIVELKWLLRGHGVHVHVERLQSDPEYRGHTTLILTVDHGRGRTIADWTDHGQKTDGAEETWLGCFGPGVTSRGESHEPGPILNRQVAGTIAAILGRDFRSAVPEAGAPIAACVGAR